MLEQGHKQAEISIAIGKDASVVSREIKRNKDERSGLYRHDLANRKYVKRQRGKPKYRKFTAELQWEVESLLREDLSPEQVVGHLKKQEKQTVSIERIYQHIWSDKKRKGDLHTHLRRQGRKYRKRGSSKDTRGIIRDRVSIDNRPKVVEKRERFGDLEVDLIIGRKHKEAIVTINDRASGMLRMKKVKSKQAKVVEEAITQLLDDWMPYIKTITSDNGKEFADHQTVAENLNVDFYFAHPYHSWERGSNENLNGLVRQYIPKQTDFSILTDTFIQSIEDKLNRRPRKRLGFQSPIFIMDQLLFNPEIAFVT